MIDLLVAQLAESEAALEVSQDAVADRDETIRELREAIEATWHEINGGAKGGEPDALAEAVGAYLDEQLDEERTERTDAADHLRAYLVSRGLPSDPVKLDDPHLDALARALL